MFHEKEKRLKHCMQCRLCLRETSSELERCTLERAGSRYCSCTLRAVLCKNQTKLQMKNFNPPLKFTWK